MRPNEPVFSGTLRSPGNRIDMRLTINGEEKEIHSSANLIELVRELKITAPHFAVALNHQVIPRSKYPDTPIQEGDTVEIVHAVGGGV